MREFRHYTTRCIAITKKKKGDNILSKCRWEREMTAGTTDSFFIFSLTCKRWNGVIQKKWDGGIGGASGGAFFCFSIIAAAIAILRCRFQKLPLADERVDLTR